METAEGTIVIRCDDTELHVEATRPTYSTPSGEAVNTVISHMLERAILALQKAGLEAEITRAPKS